MAIFDKHSPVLPLATPHKHVNTLSHSNRVEGGLRVRGEIQKKSQVGKPLVSIITVVKNGGKHLARAIQSVINQSCDNIEYIIIDGVSTDGTLDIIRKYEDFIDYWISEPDNGLYDAMNKGVRISQGEWVYFLGCDDYLVGNLSDITSNFKDFNTIYYGDVYMPNAHKLYDGKFSAYKLMLRNICHQSIFYPKRVFEKYSFGQRYKIWADYILNLRCYADKDLSFVYMRILIAIFNDWDGISRNGMDSEVVKYRKDIIRIYLPKRYFIIFCVRSTLIRVLEKLNLKKTLKLLLNR